MRRLLGTTFGRRIAVVSDAGIEHRHYDLGELPNRVSMER
jgi:hypothetical protein